jgi:hypothetical protein
LPATTLATHFEADCTKSKMPTRPLIGQLFCRIFAFKANSRIPGGLFQKWALAKHLPICHAVDSIHGRSSPVQPNLAA